MRRNKYGAKKISIDGYKFASTLEGRRYAHLRLMERAGEITGLHLQPSYQLGVLFDPITQKVKGYKYTADFAYVEDGELIIEEVKGVWTEAAKVRVRWWAQRHPELARRLRIIKRGDF